MMDWLLAVLAVAFLTALFRVLVTRKGLVDDWRKSLRWYSQWCFATIASLQGSLLVFVTQDQLAARVLFHPIWTWGELSQAVIALLAVVGFGLRLVSQESTHVEPTQ